MQHDTTGRALLFCPSASDIPPQDIAHGAPLFPRGVRPCMALQRVPDHVENVCIRVPSGDFAKSRTTSRNVKRPRELYGRPQFCFLVACLRWFLVSWMGRRLTTPTGLRSPVSSANPCRGRPGCRSLRPRVGPWTNRTMSDRTYEVLRQEHVSLPNSV